MISDRGPDASGAAFRRTRYSSGVRMPTGASSVPWKWRGAASVFRRVDVWKCGQADDEPYFKRARVCPAFTRPQLSWEQDKMED